MLLLKDHQEDQKKLAVYDLRFYWCHATVFEVSWSWMTTLEQLFLVLFWDFHYSKTNLLPHLHSYQCHAPVSVYRGRVGLGPPWSSFLLPGVGV